MQKFLIALTLAVLVTPRIGSAQEEVLSDVPGTPESIVWSPNAGQTAFISEGGGSGVLPLVFFDQTPSTALAGDVVLLIDPNGGTNTSNWAAVLNFFNPSDPDGTQGLAATDYQTFFQTNAGPNAFANFRLFTNVAYIPASSTNADGSITASYVEFGPDYSIPSGLEALFLLTASIQPNPFMITITSPISGQQVSNQESEVTVEFTGAIPGRVYAIQYSSDLETWLTASPTITAVTNSVQWIDAGPPQTASSPAQQSARYYRVALLPAN